MDDRESAWRAVAPWLEDLEALDRWHGQRAAANVSTTGADLQDLRGVLQAMARGEVGIAPDLPAAQPGGPTLEGWLLPGSSSLGQRIRRRRSAVLRLGLWRVLRNFLSRPIGATGTAPPLRTWHASIASAALGVPPGLAPALRYATSDSAARFFDQELRRALVLLSTRIDDGALAYAGYAQQEPFDDTGVSVHAWSHAWSAAVAGVYLDWLDQRSRGSVEAALDHLWLGPQDQVHFRPPAGLAVLPSRERAMHIDLWTDVVVAQALEHSAVRWRAATGGVRWHRVEVAMHDLGERTRGSRARGDARTQIRGWGVGLLYQAVFLDRAALALARMPDPGATAVGAGRSPATRTITIDLMVPRPGHESNFEFVVRWCEPSDEPPTQRLVGSPSVTAFTAAQHEVFKAWQHRHDARRASRLRPESLGWQAATDDDRFEDEERFALVPLGHVALWSTVDADTSWVDFSVVVRDQGRWHDLAAILHDAIVDGELRTWVLLAPSAQASGPTPKSLQHALANPDAACWASRPAGVGAFVTLAIDLERGSLGASS